MLVFSFQLWHKQKISNLNLEIYTAICVKFHEFVGNEKKSQVKYVDKHLSRLI